ncbi:MAG: sulfotransferase [Oscillatoria sp. PMC 1051.18]|nr:sulfotransferase [Oscillatoria sp. PMC 1050.18]MEC5030577.1 sulfotransferase [Oscillatoria sp. PMC 1051.18]
MNVNKLPDFIIIGGGKCGTTSLHDYLSQHPQIYICPQKETFFFINEPNRSYHKRWGAITELEEYQALFKDAPENSVIGEISTTYYSCPESARLIREVVPNVKIIAILRDPADRAFSDYQMHVREGNEKPDMKGLISPENKHVKRGFYYSELLPFFETFDRKQIKILLFDDLCKDAASFLQDLFSFVGVDDSFVPNMSKKGREGGLPKNQAVNQLLTKKNPVRSFAARLLKIFLPLSTRQKIRESLVKKNIEKVKLSPEERKQMIEIYRSDILKLEKLIDRDLSAWLK